MTTRKPTFLRSDTARHIRLGKKSKKLQVWRRPRGRHNKIRRKRFGYPLQPGVGFATPKHLAGKINGKTPLLVHNLKELSKATKHNIIIMARIGARKKMDLLKKINEMNLELLNGAGKWNLI